MHGNALPNRSYSDADMDSDRDIMKSNLYMENSMNLQGRLELHEFHPKLRVILTLAIFVELLGY